MKIRYPINIISTDLEKAISNVSSLLNASKVLEVQEGVKIDDLYFIGPVKLVQDLYATQSNFEKKSLRILVDEKAKLQSANRNKKIIANGAYLPAKYKGNNPFLMLYKRIDVLGGKPVLISENYLTPGELVVVPETSEHFAVMFYNDGQICKIPNEIKWFCWYADKEQDETEEPPLRKYQINYTEFTKRGFKDIELITLKKPLLESKYQEQLMSTDNPVIQIAPIISTTDAKELLKQLKDCKAWVRRTGENNILYTQETFDILEFSQKGDSPTIFKTLIEKLQSVSLVKVMSKISGLNLSVLREVYAFHMKANEFITKHADSELGGQLLVRFNWLLQSPTGREHDLRFWIGNNEATPIFRCRAIPNSATIFYLGDKTPHDLTPLPEDADKFRYNIVITFGKYAE